MSDLENYTFVQKVPPYRLNERAGFDPTSERTKDLVKSGAIKLTKRLEQEREAAKAEAEKAAKADNKGQDKAPSDKQLKGSSNKGVK